MRRGPGGSAGAQRSRDGGVSGAVRGARRAARLHQHGLRVRGAAGGGAVRGGRGAGADEPVRRDEAGRGAGGAGRVRAGGQGGPGRRAARARAVRRRGGARRERRQCSAGYGVEGPAAAGSELGRGGGGGGGREREEEEEDLDGSLGEEIPDQHGGRGEGLSRYVPAYHTHRDTNVSHTY